jgi:hypothetical protein
MAKFTAQRAIKKGGEIHPEGTVLEFHQDEAAVLLELGAIAPFKEPKPAKDPDPKK